MLCVTLNASDMHSRTQVIMGTFCTIELEKKEDIQHGFKYLKVLEKALSSYDSNATLYRLNKEKKVPNDIYLNEILDQSIYYFHKTKGYFDISIGSITKKLYRFGEKETIPSSKKLQNAYLGVDTIKLSKHEISIDESITLDLGGIGKGFAIDKLAKLYRNKGIKKGKLALSGDIRCLDICKISIQNPFIEDEIIFTLKSKINNLSISTSGTYRRFIKTQKNHHIINPKKKSPSKDFISVTIVADDDNTYCDAIATAIASMPKAFALEWLKTQQEFGYILITSKKKVFTGNLEKFIEIESS